MYVSKITIYKSYFTVNICVHCKLHKNILEFQPALFNTDRFHVFQPTRLVPAGRMDRDRTRNRFDEVLGQNDLELVPVATTEKRLEDVRDANVLFVR